MEEQDEAEPWLRPVFFSSIASMNSAEQGESHPDSDRSAGFRSKTVIEQGPFLVAPQPREWPAFFLLLMGQADFRCPGRELLPRKRNGFVSCGKKPRQANKGGYNKAVFEPYFRKSCRSKENKVHCGAYF
ncbi:hypothetical protein ACLBWT_02620 [Paenibacillus sp. D51F]